MLRIGIDLGGSKIEIAAFSETGECCHRQRVPTPAGDYRATVGAVAALVESAEATLHAHASVGVGIPGSESPVDERIRNANSTCLNGQPLRRDLQTLLQREVRLANDANCFALSEATDGAAAGAAVVFGVILGTGVGGGLVIRGQRLDGANRIAGEWGHNPFPRTSGDGPARRCWCGRMDCIETWLSGPALSADHAGHGGAVLSAHALATAAVAGEAACTASLGRYADRLARGLASVINLVDPDVIVLGGGLSQIDALYAEVPARWSAGIFSDHIQTRLVPPRHGDASGVRGAARLWAAA